MTPRSLFARVARAALVGLVAVLASSASADDGKEYGIVIDAGSTGSRVHIFAWPARSFARVPVPLSVPIEQVEPSMKVTPGIDTAAGLEQLANLLTVVKQNSSLRTMPDRWAEIPIFLKATAGMRILPAAQRDANMELVRNTLKTSGFKWVTDLQARVISGEEEGVFGWITANYWQNRLVAGTPYSLSNTLGAMDLGGASTQITFRPASPDFLSNLFNLQLGQQIVENLYTHSFLYFGQNEAIRRLNQMVQQSLGMPPPAGLISNPCLSLGLLLNYTDADTGYTSTFNGTGDFDTCLSLYVNRLMDKGEICLTDPKPTASPLPLARRTTSVNTDADAEADERESAYEYIDLEAPFHRVEDRVRAGAQPTKRFAVPRRTLAPPDVINTNTTSTCSIGGTYQPPTNGITLLGFSGFSYAWQFYNLNYTSSTLSEFRAAATGFCSIPWAQAVATHPSFPVDLLQTYCVFSVFVYGLLTTGYGFSDTGTSVIIADPTTGIDYGWALGSMIFDANAALFSVIFPETYETKYVTAAAVAGALGFVILVGLVTFFICRRRNSNGGQHSGHTTLNPLDAK